MLNVKSAVFLPTSSGHPAVPALQLIGGVGGCVCGENVDGTQPSDVNGLGLLTREAREWLGGGWNSCNNRWIRAGERMGSRREKGRGETPAVTTEAQEHRLQRETPIFNVHEGKEGGSPLLRWTPSKCANLGLLCLLHQHAFFWI